MQLSRFSLGMIATVLLLIISGCSHEMTLKASELKYPVSLTKGFMDEKMKIMTKNDSRLSNHSPSASGDGVCAESH